MSEKSDNLTPIYIHGITIDPGKWKVLVDGKPISVTAQQFRLLHCLARNAGRFLSRQQIIERIHTSDSQVTEHLVEVLIATLRWILGDHGHLIETKRNVGYRFRVQDSPQVLLLNGAEKLHTHRPKTPPALAQANGALSEGGASAHPAAIFSAEGCHSGKKLSPVTADRSSDASGIEKSDR